ncbi:anthranilate phosphoribosyltransferase [Fluviicola sp.]|uniref:anthranilate phosphoribosyltransferase n=1 Tax=Fluviicola sp. TaxID=1917219 RepID=UPI0031DBC250
MNYLKKLIDNGTLSREEARLCMIQIGRDEISDAQIVAIITTIRMRGLQISELEGFQDALIELAKSPELHAEQSIDCCGTGGDGKNTFNISTLTSFVLASMGYQVVKHGNYGVSSLCGSSTVLEYLGYEFSANPVELQRQLDQHNICFLHAPLFHPALLRVAPLRKSIGITTLFNGLGPLVNPHPSTHQLTGTYSLELAKQYQHILKSKRVNFTVLHGLSGYDELTFIGGTRVFHAHSEQFIQHSPNQLRIRPEEISGGNSVAEAARIFTSILRGEGTETQHTVLAGNVALALQTLNSGLNFEHAFSKAYEHIRSGKSFYTFKNVCL